MFFYVTLCVIFHNHNCHCQWNGSNNQKCHANILRIANQYSTQTNSHILEWLLRIEFKMFCATLIYKIEKPKTDCFIIFFLFFSKYKQSKRKYELIVHFVNDSINIYIYTLYAYMCVLCCYTISINMYVCRARHAVSILSVFLSFFDKVVLRVAFVPL